MLFHITLSDSSTVIGAIQGYGGECATLTRAREYVTQLRRRNVRPVYIKVNWNAITNEHTRMDVLPGDIVSIDIP